MGYLLLKSFSPFQTIANIVRFHHVPWMNGEGTVFDGLPVPRESHLLELADRVAVLLDPATDVLGQVDRILHKIHRQSGERFVPEQVQALEMLATRVRSDPTLTEIFAHHEADELWATLEQQSAGRAFLFGLRAFLDRYSDVLGSNYLAEIFYRAE